MIASPTTPPDWEAEIDPQAAERCEQALADLAGLPAFDGTVRRILATLDDENSSNDQILAALESDATFTANLIRFANSPVRAHPIRAKTARQAVIFVGRPALRRLTVETATFRFLERAPGNGRAAAGQLHLHALAVALAALRAADAGGHDAEIVHLGGLLHDVGKLVLPLAFGEELLDEIATTTPNGRPRVDAELAQLGITHAQAGALLARRWGLDERIADAIAWHHGGPSLVPCPTPEIACVQLANIVAAMLAGGAADHDLMQDALESTGLGVEVLDELATGTAAAPALLADTSVSDRIARLERLAQFDDLTGIAGRRHWQETVTASIEQDGERGVVMLIDVDHFKEINDQLGHAVGDHVLKVVAELLGQHGFAGRIGGDEFVLWAPVDLADAQARAERLLVELAELTTEREDLPPVGLSIGIAGTPAEGTAALATLCATADTGLYDAKRAGRNQVVVAVGSGPGAVRPGAVVS